MRIQLFAVVLGLALWGAYAQAQSIGTSPVSTVPTTNGSVTEILEYNNLIIIGGGFSEVNSQPRTALAAFDKTTGALHAWDPAFSGAVRDMLIVNNTLYVCGTFSTVDGQSRGQLASFNLGSMGASNHGLTSWDPMLSYVNTCFFFGNNVECLAYMNDTLYVGGFFGTVNGTTRGGLASFDLNNLANNDGLTNWDPNTYTNNGQTGTGFDIWGVFNICAHAGSDTIVLSGPFEGVGGVHMTDGTASPHAATARSSFAAVSGSGTGVVRNWAPSLSNAAWNDDAMILDGDVVFHGAPRSGTPRAVDVVTTNFTGFTPNLDDQAYTIGVHPSGSMVFMSGIWTTANSTAVNELLAFDAAGNVISGWDPDPNTYALSMLVTTDRVYVGGTFSTISGQSRQGLAAYDITPAAPTITTSNPLPSGTAGTSYSHQFAASSGTPGYTWGATGLPGGWSMSNSGLLTSSNPAPGSLNFDVTVTDSASQQATVSFDVTINAPQLSITTSSALPQGTENVAYSAQLNASGGWGSYTWGVATGSSLPSGWSINSSTGEISAAAGSVQPGTFNFSIRVTDGQPASATRAFSVTVIAVVPALNITSSASLPGGTHGTSYSFQFTATGGTGNYSWAVVSGGVPTGMSLNSSTGVLSGTAQGGSYNFVIAVTSGSQTDSQGCTLNVNYPALNITTGATLPQGTENVAYSAQINATGGTGTYSWSAGTSSLPTGWSIGASTGLISAAANNVSPGTFNFTIICTSGSQSDSRAFSVTVIAATPTLTITSPNALPQGTHMVAYNYQLAATGGAGSYSWSVISGSLPGGLALNASTGVLSGSPQGGSYSFTVQVAAGTQTDSKGFTLDVVFPALSITTAASLPSGTQNVAYAAQLNATGGTGSYVWNVATGSSLPAGWTLSSANGLISAGASFVQPGTFNFTIEVGSGTQTTSRAFSVTITQTVTPVQITSSTTLPAGTDGTAYSHQLTATGGQGGYTWGVYNGSSLPTGWSIAASTGVISAPAGSVTAGNYSFEIEVTDGNTTDFDTFNVTINGNAITITTSTLPDAVEGQPYAATLDVTGGTGIGYDWTLVSGGLPVGITGIPGVGPSIGLTGSPVGTGAASFTVRVTDNLGNFTDKSFSITVLPAGSTPGGSGGEGGGSSGGGCTAGSGTAPLLLLLIVLAGYVARRRRYTH